MCCSFLEAPAPILLVVLRLHPEHSMDGDEAIVPAETDEEVLKISSNFQQEPSLQNVIWPGSRLKCRWVW